MFPFTSKLDFSLAAVLATSIYGSPDAHAAAFAYGDITNGNALLSNFNLVALGNYNNTASSSGGNMYVDGRAIVVGNVTTTSTSGTGFCSNAALCAGNATTAVDSSGKLYGALTVFGNVVSPSSYVGGGYKAGGTTYIGGNASGYVEANNQATVNIKGTTNGLTINRPADINLAGKTYQGSYSTDSPGKVSTGVSAATVFPFTSGNLISEVKSLSTGLAALPGSRGVTTQKLINGDSIFFTAGADYTNVGKNYGVITTTFANLASETNFKGIDNGTNDATFVIVTGDGANYTLPNLNSYAGSSKVIFDFVDATTLKFAGNWSGSILAPLATITSMGGTIDGSVIVNNINQTQSLYAANLFTGDLSGLVPEPASIFMFSAGLATIGALRLRRRRK